MYLMSGLGLNDCCSHAQTQVSMVIHVIFRVFPVATHPRAKKRLEDYTPIRKGLLHAWSNESTGVAVVRHILQPTRAQLSSANPMSPRRNLARCSMYQAASNTTHTSMPGFTVAAPISNLMGERDWNSSRQCRRASESCEELKRPRSQRC